MTSLPVDSNSKKNDRETRLEILLQKLQEDFQRILYKNVKTINLSPSQIILDEEIVLSSLKVTISTQSLLKN
jgi:hypothetical protein